MTLLIILSAISFLLLLAYVSPKIARKLFPLPVSEKTTLDVYFPHGLEAGMHIDVDGERLEIVDVAGSKITVRSELTVK